MMVVSFTQSVYNASEGDGRLRVTVTSTIRSPQLIVLQLVITPITAQGNVYGCYGSYTHVRTCVHICMRMYVHEYA